MITCERCNTENIDGAQYCDECGAPLARSTPEKKGGTSNTGGGTSGEGLVAEANGPVAARAEAGGTAAAAQPSLQHAMSSGSIALMDGAHARLVIERGRSAGKQFPLSDDESQIGRWDADGGIFPDVDLDADDPEAKVSRRHARIMRRNDKYFIEDLGSTNGTFINRGRRLLPGDRQPLQDGDEIIVGKTFLRFHIVK
jgi:FHA domain